MIYITGNLYNIATSQNTNSETGVISTVHTAEILHQSRGKSEIAGVKLDPSVVPSWEKAKGRDINVEVRFYAMKNREGGIQSGLVLADKKSLPMVARPAAA